MNLRDVGLNWNIKKVPIVVKGKETAYFNLVREDSNYVMGNCTSKYEVLQNQDFIKQTLGSAFENGFNVHNYEIGKVDKNGKQVYVKIDTGNDHTIAGDNVHEYLTVLRHHDGRPVGNQSFCTYDIGKYSFHVGMAASKHIKDVTCLKCAVETINNMKHMHGTTVTIQDLNVLVNHLINPDNMPMSAKKESMKSKLRETIAEHNPATAWDVFKGVIEYAETIKSSKDRQVSMFTGSSAKMIESAYSFLTKLSQK